MYRFIALQLTKSIFFKLTSLWLGQYKGPRHSPSYGSIPLNTMGHLNDSLYYFLWTCHVIGPIVVGSLWFIDGHITNTTQHYEFFISSLSHISIPPTMLSSVGFVIPTKCYFVGISNKQSLTFFDIFYL